MSIFGQGSAGDVLRPAGDEPVIEFGAFRLDARRRRLELDGERVRVGDRALDILIALAARPGELVSHNDLIDQVWPGMVADGGTLRFHITALRKALGDPALIRNVQGRGYRLAPPAEEASPPDASAPPASGSPDRAGGLPPDLGRMVRRAGAVEEITRLLEEMSFVTLVGPGGIGKTTAAIATAHVLKSGFDDTRFLDLGGLQDGAQAAAALASMFGLLITGDDATTTLASYLSERRVLLVLDGCEPVVEAAAILAEAIHRAAPRVRILATSREPLRAAGEHVLRLATLEAPPIGRDQAWADIEDYPAVQLFVERALAGGATLRRDATEAGDIAEVCRRLDGLALAIEIAAGQVTALGLAGVRELLAQNFNLLWPGRRTAVPRQQTLHATLSWSYDLLAEAERTVLQRLSVFVGGFTLPMAQEVAAGDDLADADLLEALASLVAKSLVTVQAAPAATYRLLDTTRAYALDQLRAAGEFSVVVRRHAELMYAQLAQARDEGSAFHQADAYARLRDQIGNVRTALQWSFSPDGEPALGVRLAAAASPLFVLVSLVAECRRWTEMALERLDETTRGSRHELDLQFSLVQALLLTVGNPGRARDAIARGLVLAEVRHDAHQRLRFLSADHIYRSRISEFRAALETARRMVALARTMAEPAALSIAESLLSISQHRAGNLSESRRLSESALARFPLSRRINLSLFGYDHRSRAVMAYARTLWLLGLPDRAASVARQTLAQVEQLAHPGTTTFALTWMIPVFLWNGDWETSEALIDQLLTLTREYPVVTYSEVGQCLRGEYLVRTGDALAGVALIQPALDALSDQRTQVTGQICALADGLRRIGDHDRALQVIEQAIAETNHNGHHVFLSDMTRVRGEILADAGPWEEAAEVLQAAVAIARGQGARGLELKAALSLAERYRLRGDATGARALLAPLVEAFTEGFETQDLRTARAFL